jgi:X-X-X-Leu-X-X-Gly heptad repeat protein
MRNLKYLLAAGALGGLMALPQASSASPLATGLGTVNSNTPAIADGLVQKVHGWHCQKRKGWYHGKRYWHRHWKACHRTYHYDDDYYYDNYSYSYGYPSYGYGVPLPLFFGFNFGDDDHHGRRHHKGHGDD